MFKSIKRLRRRRKIKVGSKADEIIVLGGLRKKYLTRCQILRSKDYQNMEFNKKCFPIQGRTCSNQLSAYVGMRKYR